ncbi:zinc finger protein 771-like [Brachionus plicatilis]|uniref:Zinc finger protein 771-like n=1 Tax=Brachionus plicatilis TaxID=10195 RepID=A0A3M7QNN2_BRAPC|nr:zinc finger protein 771-like [Brachionus plicatilis]
MRKKSKILNWLVKDSDSPISEKQQCQSIRDKECSVCGKYFNCAANLASHKRWHKKETLKSDTHKLEINNSLNQLFLNNFYSNYLSNQYFLPLNLQRDKNSIVVVVDCICMY